MKMDEAEKKRLNEKWKREFSETFAEMLDLVAIGRGIEIILRIAAQTREAIQRTQQYAEMMTSARKVKIRTPDDAIDYLFSDANERKRIKLARSIADLLAHGLYFHARNRQVHQHLRNQHKRERQSSGRLAS